MTITQDELKKLLHYDPEAGVFTWRVNRERGPRKAGKAAGRENNGKGVMCIHITINGRGYQAHRLAWLYMTGEFPSDGEIVRHIDGDGLDNRWSNLIKTTRNRAKSRNNKSGICGVCWFSKKVKWVAQIRINGKQKFLGYYDTIFEAACARKSAEIKLK